jgi:hypothetical protein
MKKIALFAAMFWTASGFCQTPVKEPATLQALLAEVHQLRLDIEAMTVASQRVQIALYSLQMQDAAAARSAQRLDSAHGRCIGADGDRQHTSADIQGLESTLASATAPQDQAEAVKQRLKELNNSLDTQTAAVQTCQADEAEPQLSFEMIRRSCSTCRRGLMALTRRWNNLARPANNSFFTEVSVLRVSKLVAFATPLLSNKQWPCSLQKPVAKSNGSIRLQVCRDWVRHRCRTPRGHFSIALRRTRQRFLQVNPNV